MCACERDWRAEQIPTLPSPSHLLELAWTPSHSHVPQSIPATCELSPLSSVNFHSKRLEICFFLFVLLMAVLSRNSCPVSCRWDPPRLSGTAVFEITGFNFNPWILITRLRLLCFIRFKLIALDAKQYLIWLLLCFILFQLVVSDAKQYLLACSSLN